MESNDQGHELDSLSSTRYLYNPQADSVRSIPAATLIRNDTKEPNWNSQSEIENIEVLDVRPILRY